VSRRLSIGCEFVHRSAFDVAAVFQVEPVADQKAEQVEADWAIDPDSPTRIYRDLYGNLCRRLIIPAGRSVITYRATMMVPDAVEDVDEDARELPADQLPDEVLIFTLPSRYCLPDVLGGEAWSRFGALPPGYQRVQAICDYVNGHLKFSYGSSNSRSTAADVHASGYGVCRDFTHLAVSLCRALNIPARYVFGYLPEIEVPPRDAPMDFAAWMEVYLGDRWWTFDPRNNQPRKGRVLIGRGRDASDVAMATTFGAPVLESMKVIAEEVVEPSVATA
jgi:transglutaminase-like putative cysteine protease